MPDREHQVDRHESREEQTRDERRPTHGPFEPGSLPLHPPPDEGGRDPRIAEIRDEFIRRRAGRDPVFEVFDEFPGDVHLLESSEPGPTHDDGGQPPKRFRKR